MILEIEKNIYCNTSHVRCKQHRPIRNCNHHVANTDGNNSDNNRTALHRAHPVLRHINKARLNLHANVNQLITANWIGINIEIASLWSFATLLACKI